ncbi:MAG: hypothetical protein MUD01_10160, partial [Chloroflexaceae bacterium]|nr:hypothetical protein [Chloroflexaceae bacterium]
MAAQPYFRTPALSADGRQLAFVYGGDIWLVDAGGGNAERLTAHPAGHRCPRFSPDGATLAFTSNRTGSGDVYLLPLTGGDTERLTYHDQHAEVEDWSADGQHLYITSSREQMGNAIYRVGLAGGTPVFCYGEAYENLGHMAVSPDGGTLAFNNVRERWWRRGPNPFAPCEIWLAPTELQIADCRLQTTQSTIYNLQSAI